MPSRVVPHHTESHNRKRQQHLRSKVKNVYYGNARSVIKIAVRATIKFSSYDEVMVNARVRLRSVVKVRDSTISNRSILT